MSALSSRPASSSRCSGRPAAARPRCCASSPASSTPTEGNIILDGEDASGKHVRERQVGFVFQHYALFRHMTVFDNVAFGLRVKPRQQRLPERQIKRNVKELLELVQLDWLADRYPSQLSGGQRQRIALARALAVRPRVLLLDEPFGALDAKVRKELRRWLRRLHDELHITSLFVTHDQDEAVELADRLVLMNRGKVEQAGTVREVYAKPATPFVYSFLGAVNKFTGHVQGDFLRVGGDVMPIAGGGGGRRASTPLPSPARTSWTLSPTRPAASACPRPSAAFSTSAPSPASS